MKYYWCVNCGYYGSFSIYVQKNAKCQICEYEDLLELTEEEYEKTAKHREFQDKSVFYTSKGRKRDKL